MERVVACRIPPGGMVENLAAAAILNFSTAFIGPMFPSGSDRERKGHPVGVFLGEANDPTGRGFASTISVFARNAFAQPPFSALIVTSYSSVESQLPRTPTLPTSAALAAGDYFSGRSDVSSLPVNKSKMLISLPNGRILP